MSTIQRGTGRPRPGVRSIKKNSGDLLRSRNDRDIHDEVIHYLSDAGLRLAQSSNDFLDQKQAERAQRFSHFLARRYYRDRLSRAFRYSATLLGTGRIAEQITDSPEFHLILERCVLGSLATSREVGDLAVSVLLSMRSEGWWSELLEYERAFFLQLATSEVTPASTFPQKSISTLVRRFRLQVPELLARLKSGTHVGDDLDGEATLLFSRTTHGKIYVVELDEKTSAVFQSIDDNRSANEIAALCGASQQEIQRILAALSDIGSVVLPN